MSSDSVEIPKDWVEKLFKLYEVYCNTSMYDILDPKICGIDCTDLNKLEAAADAIETIEYEIKAVFTNEPSKT